MGKTSELPQNPGKKTNIRYTLRQEDVKKRWKFVAFSGAAIVVAVVYGRKGFGGLGMVVFIVISEQILSPAKRLVFSILSTVSLHWGRGGYK